MTLAALFLSPFLGYGLGSILARRFTQLHGAKAFFSTFAAGCVLALLMFLLSYALIVMPEIAAELERGGPTMGPGIKAFALAMIWSFMPLCTVFSFWRERRAKRTPK